MSNGAVIPLSLEATDFSRAGLAKLEHLWLREMGLDDGNHHVIWPSPLVTMDVPVAAILNYKLEEAPT
jgi:hypothetical protein